MNLTETEFLNVKDAKLIQIRDIKYSEAYSLANSRLIEIIRLSEFPILDLLPEIEKLTLSEVQSFGQAFLNQAYFIAGAYGNITPEETASIAEEFYQQLGMQPLPVDQFRGFEGVRIEQGSSYFHSVNLEGKNHGWVSQYQFGEKSPEIHAAISIGTSLLKPQFFDDLRTQKALGYVVGLMAYEANTVLGITFYIQSHQPLAQVSSLAEEWIQSAASRIEKLSQQEFDNLKSAELEPLLPPNQSFEMQASEFKYAIVHKQGDIHWRQKKIDALQKITKEEVVRIFQQALNPTTHRKLTVFAIGNQGSGRETIPNQGEVISNIEEFKAKIGRYYLPF